MDDSIIELLNVFSFAEPTDELLPVNDIEHITANRRIAEHNSQIANGLAGERWDDFHMAQRRLDSAIQMAENNPCPKTVANLRQAQQELKQAEEIARETERAYETAQDRLDEIRQAEQRQRGNQLWDFVTQLSPDRKRRRTDPS